MIKKTLFVSALVLFFGLAPHVFAEGFVPLAVIPGLTDIQPTQEGLANFFNNLYKFVVGLSAALAVIMIIWGGLEYSTQDSISKKSDGKERIKQAIFGLVLVLSPVLVFSIINPSILNLSLNLEKLDTQTRPPTGTGSGTGTQTPATDTTSGCSVSGTAGVLQIATCPSVTAATTWGQSCSGILSTATPLSISAGGGTAQNIITCSGAQNYVFIETTGVASFSKTINRIMPLAVTIDSPNNGSNALLFTNICATAGRKTCISDIPQTTFSTECLPKPTTLISVSSGGSGKCYKEKLSCQDTSGSTYCTDTPGWTPFQ